MKVCSAAGCTSMAFLLVLQVALLVGVCTACSEPMGWQPEPVTVRVNDGIVDVVFLGNVTLTTPPRFNRFFHAQVYGAEVSVECVYKKLPGMNVYKEVTVLGFGESQDCTNTEVEPNKRYIFLATPYQDGYSIVEANVQLGAEPATTENTQLMLDSFGCDGPSEPTTPPPTTTPLPTTRLPTTEPPTVPMTTTPPKASDDDGDDDDHDDPINDGTTVASSCFIVLSAVVLVLQFNF